MEGNLEEPSTVVRVGDVTFRVAGEDKGYVFHPWLREARMAAQGAEHGSVGLLVIARH